MAITPLERRRETVSLYLSWGRRYAVAPTLLLLAFVLPPTDGAHLAGVPTLCGLRLLTGLSCPGCGITRSVVFAAHGDLPAALRLHPLGPVVFVSLLAFAILRLTGADDWLVRRLPHWLGETGGGVLLAAVLGVWVARLAGWLPIPP